MLPLWEQKMTSDHLFGQPSAGGRLLARYLCFLSCLPRGLLSPLRGACCGERKWAERESTLSTHGLQQRPPHGRARDKGGWQPGAVIETDSTRCKSGDGPMNESESDRRGREREKERERERERESERECHSGRERIEYLRRKMGWFRERKTWN